MENTKLKKELSLFVATMLVCGNMVGSGVFMLPTTLAINSGPLSTMIAWILTSGGSILIALSFAKLGSKYPQTGGPYHYTKLAFGEFTGFLSAWLYWNGSWIGNAAIIIALTSYSAAIIPALNDPLMAIIYSSAVLWLFTFINILNVKRAGNFQAFATLFKIVFFIAFIIIALLNFDASNLSPLLPEGKGLETISVAATTTLWAFVGLESSSVIAGEIKDPERNVSKSTIYGILITAVLYILITFASMGAMSNETLSKSSAPFTDIIYLAIGSRLGVILGAAIIICILGTTMGWLLSTARVAFAAGEDGVFPKFFGKVSKKFNTPVASLIIGSVLVNILLIMKYQDSMVTAFDFVTKLAVLSFLPVYLLTATAEIFLMFNSKEKFGFFIFVKKSILPLLAFAYTIWTIYGSGAEAVMLGFIMMLLGVPFYIYNYHSNKLGDKVNR